MKKQNLEKKKSMSTTPKEQFPFYIKSKGQKIKKVGNSMC